MAAAGARVVAVLTRAPSAGGKTRLFATLGRAPDPALLRALLLDTLAGVAAPAVTRVVAVDPADACGEVRALVPGDVFVMPQPAGGLGDRMRGVMAAALAGGARAVALVGSDLPEIEPDRVTETFALLEESPDRLVLGPAADGGYYLIGATSVPDVFEGVAWGTPAVLEQTVAAAARRGLRVHLLAPMRDIDTAADLRRLADGAGRTPSLTLAWCREHGVCGNRTEPRQTP